jgi:hypothetical protein
MRNKRKNTINLMAALVVALGGSLCIPLDLLGANGDNARHHLSVTLISSPGREILYNVI